ncbi:FAD-dependent oxidoreductase [Clostridium brassicae]|uniref:FAD-dependent oxidoreductase n=1 Tax=Clostridium brassicae TaxID=2999072 RepID=A0ABT4DDN8_9CLOT|nr:FAD-dependent oxidoreductase [Clostridium brassicae]MCY6960425.1 FAD-dependent oxidoreductase [Clostridium brassicae]
MGKKILIVGGSAGGASTATRLRRLDKNAEITMYEKGEYISYSSCGLPYYIGDIITDKNNLILKTPKSFKEKHNVNVKINSHVLEIDPKNQNIKILSNHKILTESYDYLILSPGAKPFTDPIYNLASNKIFTLRTIDDADNIKSYIRNNNIKNALVIGGGYIGIEICENLKKIGLNVTVVQSAPHILAPFDSDISELIENELSKNGINLILNDSAVSFNDKPDHIDVELKSNTVIRADMIILAIGIRPDIDFLKNSGIALGSKGHIVVNDKMQTNFDNIYALGDAVEICDFINKSKTAIALAPPTVKQADIVANNIMGIPSFYDGSLGSALIKVFDLTCGSTGNNERTLKQHNIPYKVVYTKSKSNAAYYPESKTLKLKLIFNSEGYILGSQIIGYKGVDKRLDVISTIISLKGTIFDAAKLQLAYAPAYSIPTDIVNSAALKAISQLNS